MMPAAESRACRPAKFAAALVALFAFFIAAGPALAEVSNLRLEQQGDRVFVTYDLNDGVPVEVSALFAVNRRLLPHKLLNVDGDIGPGIAPGKDKRIRWDVRRDFLAGLETGWAGVLMSPICTSLNNFRDHLLWMFSVNLIRYE